MLLSKMAKMRRYQLLTGVGDSITDDVLQEDLEDATGLFIAIGNQSPYK